jgi:2-amino-4-hydroxy-6-hydroxymethyldihydropteridine diphosphokinase
VETEAYIALGSNLGDRKLNLLRAVSELGRLAGCRVTAISRFYETAPVGMSAETPPFLNGALRLTTGLGPRDLLHELQRIEQQVFGRRASPTAISRRMDLDLLLFGRQVLTEPDLTVPHPRMLQRRFVLQPLADIAPQAVEPLTGRTIAELLANLQSDERVTPLEP